MAEAVTINVESRDPQKNKGTGSRVARKLRAQGRVPAIIYGHKQPPVPISLSREDVLALLKKGSHLTQLQIGGQSEMALIRDVQWDHLGKEIIHLDFFRVNAEERVTTDVPLVLHGTAPGISEGGILEQPAHALSVSCRATEFPESIRIEIGELHIDGMIHVRDLTLPEGVTTDADPDLVLVHIVRKGAAPAPAAAEEGAETAEGEAAAIGGEEEGGGVTPAPRRPRPRHEETGRRPGQPGQQVRGNPPQHRLRGRRSTGPRSHPAQASARKFDGQLAETEIDFRRVLLLKPETFMNLSGRSVRQVAAVLQDRAVRRPGDLR